MTRIALALASPAYFALISFIAPAELWNFHGAVAAFGVVALGVSIVGVSLVLDQIRSCAC